ncbi:hypothetical protein MUP77_22180 [Candidatus Bathyarchaeota archaeon]|nr:hypothetical protein [Candidatus Bathyarchaeota archaeon]
MRKTLSAVCSTIRYYLSKRKYLLKIWLWIKKFKIRVRSFLLKAWLWLMKWKRPIVASLVALPTIFTVWYYDLLPATWSLVKELGLIGWGIYMVIEWLIGRKEAERQARLYAQAKQKLEDEAKRREEVKGYLKRHYENDILPVMRDWFKPSSKNVVIDPRSMSYSLLSGCAYYHPYGKSYVAKISEPELFPKNIVEEAVEHLTKGYPENWKKWLVLKDRVNDHLKRIVTVWEEIEGSVKIKTKELGLAEWEGGKPNPASNYYHVDSLVEIIWSDPEYYQSQKKHMWDEYDIRPDEKGGFEFGGTWAHSQKREILEKTKHCLTNESDRISGVKKNLWEQRSKLEKDGKDFEDFLKEIEDDWARRNIRIRSSCPTCKDYRKGGV